MPLRALLRHLLNNEQLIQKLAESYPIRRAAQLTAYFSLRGKQLGEGQLEKLKETDIVNRMKDEAKHSATQFQNKVNSSVDKTSRFFITFTNSLEEEWKKAEEKLKDQKKFKSETRETDNDEKKKKNDT